MFSLFPVAWKNLDDRSKASLIFQVIIEPCSIMTTLFYHNVTFVQTFISFDILP